MAYAQQPGTGETGSPLAYSAHNDDHDEDDD
jgi:hypothetical protein